MTEITLPSPPLRGRRIVLRDIELKDLVAHAHWMQPGHAWQAFDGPDLPRNKPEEIPATIEKLRATIAVGSFRSPRVRLAIADRTTDAYIGTVSSYLEQKEPPRQAAGIVIFDSDRWGRGLGFEALGLWVDYLFKAQPEMHRLSMWTWSGNRSMMRLAEKLGFLEEARIREQRIVAGSRYDSVGYGLLRREWETSFPDGFTADSGLP